VEWGVRNTYFSSARTEACLTCFMSGSKDKFIIFRTPLRMLQSKLM
jgi:hypothetical protein